MDKRPEKSLELSSMFGPVSGPIDPDRSLSEENPGQSSDSGLTPSADDSGREVEAESVFPSWSNEVSHLSSWLPADDYATSIPPMNMAMDASKPPEIPPSDAPRPLDDGSAFLLASEGAGKGGWSSGKTPSKSGPSGTDDFDPEELAPPKWVEGEVLFRKYLLQKKLGFGGMGEVWKVRHLDLDCDRALKFIRTNLSSSPELRRRFRREARVMAKLSHPNVVQIHDAFTVGGMAFIDMAFLPGQTLAEFLKGRPPMSLDWTVWILQQLCDVLAVAHEAGIVHRDLKPANLMLLDGRKPGRESLRVLDFGIAKLLSIEEIDGPSITNNGPIGTHPYMSPEQFGIGQATVDTRTDIYAVGVILFEILTGCRPFSGGNQIGQWVHKHLNEPVPTFHDRNPKIDLSPEVEAVVRRCLAKSPNDRPESAQALFEEFDAACGLLRRSTPSSPSNEVIPTRVPPTVSPSPTDPVARPLIAPLKPTEAESREPVPVPDPDPDPIELPAILEISDPPSTQTGSYEWTVSDVSETAIDELSEIPVSTLVPIPEEEFDDQTSSERSDATRSRRKLLRLVACLVLVGSLGVGAALFIASKIPKEPTFTKVPERIEWEKNRYALYESSNNNRIFPIPEGYAPVGKDCDEDGWPRVIVREDGVRFIRIGGTTTPYKAFKPVWKMGDHRDGHWCPDDDSHLLCDKEQPVDIAGYYIQETEVTNREFDRYYEKIQDNKELVFELDPWYQDYKADLDMVADPKGKRPAVYITRRAAEGYARSVGGVLPSRPEWEYAASSRGVRNDFVWEPLTTEAEEQKVSIGVARRDVKISDRDVTLQGVFDMGGNVREWSGDLRNGESVACGGSFQEYFPAKLDNCGVKAIHPVTNSSNDVGFRVVLRCPPATRPVTP